MELSREDAQNLVYDDLEGFEEISDEITDHGRWAVTYLYTCKHVATGKYYQVEYRLGATELQDESPFEYDDEPIKLTEVKPVQKMVTVYEPVLLESLGV